jgi:hypothetical protein
MATFAEKYNCLGPSHEKRCSNCLRTGLKSTPAFYYWKDNASVYLCDDCYTYLCVKGCRIKNPIAIAKIEKLEKCTNEEIKQINAILFARYKASFRCNKDEVNTDNTKI